MKIEELLASRTDLSTFLVHLTRAADGVSAKERLKRIIRQDRLVAASPFGMAVGKLQELGLSTLSQNVVCFTETPMEHLSLLASPIEGRAVRFEPYGIGITRKQGRKLGANPVWYIDITPRGGVDWLTVPINRMVNEACTGDNFDESDIAQVAPFFEQMGTGIRVPGAAGPGYRKEFWWEREWRKVGDVRLPGTYLILCPVADRDELREEVERIEMPDRPEVSFIDPTWSMESIIGSLAGFGVDDLGPF